MNVALYATVAERAGLRCEYCRAPAAVFKFGHEKDHIAPVSRGGTDDLENLALACCACNSYKHGAQTGLDETSGEEVALFNPRRDLWTEHLSIVDTNGRQFKRIDQHGSCHNQPRAPEYARTNRRTPAMDFAWFVALKGDVMQVLIRPVFNLILKEPVIYAA